MHLLVTDFQGLITPHPNTGQPFLVHCGTCGAKVAEGAGAVHIPDFPHVCPDTTSAIREWSITWMPAEEDVPLPLESVDLDA